MASASKAVVSITNVEPTLRLMAKYGRDFNRMVRDTVKRDVSPYVAHQITAAASGSTKQARAVAGTFKPTGDRLPAVRGLGSRRVTSSKVPAGALGFGANWGGGQRQRTYRTRSRLGRPYVVTRQTTQQFGAWTGGGEKDRFIYSTISDHTPQINERWQRALDDVYQAWRK